MVSDAGVTSAVDSSYVARGSIACPEVAAETGLADGVPAVCLDVVSPVPFAFESSDRMATPSTTASTTPMTAAPIVSLLVHTGEREDRFVRRDLVTRKCLAFVRIHFFHCMSIAPLVRHRPESLWNRPIKEQIGCRNRE